MRSVKGYPGVGAVARRRQEGEGAAEAKSHHGNFAVALRMLLEIGNRIGEVPHAQLEIRSLRAKARLRPSSVQASGPGSASRQNMSGADATNPWAASVSA